MTRADIFSVDGTAIRRPAEPPRRPPRTALLAAAACAGVALAGALGTAEIAHAQDAQPDAPTELTFGGSTTWIGQVPIMVALEKGFFEEQGLDVEFRTILTSGDRLAALTAGAIDFSNLGRSSVIADMARGNEAFYYFANIDDSPGNEGCWARAGIESFEDLRGQPVAANTSAEITLAGLLEASGMTMDDIEFVNLPPNEMAPALANGDVQAACVWQPLLDGLEEAAPDGSLLGTDRDTAMFEQFGTMASPDIVIISRELVDEHPETAAKLADAIFQGAQYVTENPEESAEAVAHYFNLPPEQVLEGINAFQYFGQEGWPEHMELHTAQMQELAQWLYDNGRIAELPNVADWENTEFLTQP